MIMLDVIFCTLAQEVAFYIWFLPNLVCGMLIGGGHHIVFNILTFHSFIRTTPSFLIQITQVRYQNNQWSFWKRTEKKIEILFQFRGIPQILKRWFIMKLFTQNVPGPS